MFRTETADPKYIEKSNKKNKQPDYQQHRFFVIPVAYQVVCLFNRTLILLVAIQFTKLYLIIPVNLQRCLFFPERVEQLKDESKNS